MRESYEIPRIAAIHVVLMSLVFGALIGFGFSDRPRPYRAEEHVPYELDPEYSAWVCEHCDFFAEEQEGGFTWMGWQCPYPRPWSMSWTEPSEETPPDHANGDAR